MTPILNIRLIIKKGNNSLITSGCEFTKSRLLFPRVVMRMIDPATLPENSITTSCIWPDCRLTMRPTINKVMSKNVDDRINAAKDPDIHTRIPAAVITIAPDQAIGLLLPERRLESANNMAPSSVRSKKPNTQVTVVKLKDNKIPSKILGSKYRIINAGGSIILNILTSIQITVDAIIAKTHV